MGAKKEPPAKKVAVLLRVDAALLAKIDDYLQRCRELGMSGSRASVVLGAARRGIDAMSDEITAKGKR
jgi:hypothetical protein